MELELIVGLRLAGWSARLEDESEEGGNFRHAHADSYRKTFEEKGLTINGVKVIKSHRKVREEE